jgi:hypothetical protein
MLVGPPGETRDWLEALIAQRADIHLVGVHTDSDRALDLLKYYAGRKRGVAMVDARLPALERGRSVIRMVRERFPTLRIVAYAEELDEGAMDGLYFVGADAVIGGPMGEPEVVAAILGSTPRLMDRPPAIREPKIRKSAIHPPQISKPEVTEPAVAGPEVTEPEVNAPEAPVPAAAIAPDIPRPRPRIVAVPTEPVEAGEDENRAAWRRRAEAIWGSPVPVKKDRGPVPDAPPRDEETPPSEESSRPPVRRSVARALGLFGSGAGQRLGSILHRKRPEQSPIEDEQREAIERNLEHLVPPPWPSEPEEQAGQGARPEEPGQDDASAR